MTRYPTKWPEDHSPEFTAKQIERIEQYKQQITIHKGKTHILDISLPVDDIERAYLPIMMWLVKNNVKMMFDPQLKSVFVNIQTP
jgi:hypothetical protein